MKFLNPRITINYKTDCVPTNDILLTSICTKKSCYDLPDVIASGKSFDVTLVDPIVDKKSKYPYFIKISTKDGYTVATSTYFEVGTPYIKVTQ